MRLSAQSIVNRVGMITPFSGRKDWSFNGFRLSWGLGPAGYDVRIAEGLLLRPGEFALASTIEQFKMPTDVSAEVYNKSSWARRGLNQTTTVIEPGWHGFLTLELKNLHHDHTLTITAGMPIAHVVFNLLDHATCLPYDGKYQNQEAGPQEAR